MIVEELVDAGWFQSSNPAEGLSSAHCKASRNAATKPSLPDLPAGRLTQLMDPSNDAAVALDFEWRPHIALCPAESQTS
ncbi:hypothetical protein [Rhizobium ruizarguesonis]|uniref:hypothetical protein n=1 Tax=Rhizobium ruizarguesonis TaxID=2081791 RepID=UPI0013EE4E68|nr:hypothetical protein [Rhizobium ruizarguesonis]